MTCDNAFEQMSAALDGELSAEETAQLDRHLAHCEACRALFADLSAIHSACGGLEVTPPPGLKTRILQNLPAQTRPAKVTWIHWKRWAAMAATFVLISLAAWQLPKTVFTNPSQSTSDQTVETRGVEATTPSPGAMARNTSAPAEEPIEIEDTPGIALFSAGSETPADETPAPTPAPDFFSGDPVDVNASRSVPAQVGKESQKRGVMAAGVGDATDPVPDAADQDTEDLATYSVATTDAADIGITSPIRVPVSVVSFPPQIETEPGEETVVTETSLDEPAVWDEEAHQELHPELTEEENVPVTLFIRSIVDESGGAAVYCGILTLESDVLLVDYPTQTQESGETWYELPSADFCALVNKLTDSETDYDLRIEGDDVSPDAPMGLVIVLPEEDIP